MSSEDILSEWAGMIVGTMFRCWISKNELADSAGMTRQRLWQILKDNKPIEDRTKAKVEAALVLCIRKRGLSVEDVFPQKS